MTQSHGSTSTVDVFSALIADWNLAVDGQAKYLPVDDGVISM